MFFRWTALLAVIVATCVANAQVKFRNVEKDVIVSRLQSAPKTVQGRADWLKTTFAASGCGSGLTEQLVKHEKTPNIICVIPGTSEREIVIGAHYDFVNEGQGIVDNWSGASLLPSLVEALTSEPHRHTLVFIAFTGEEEELVGSKAYVKRLTKPQRANVSAMVNVDTLGLGPTKVWATVSDRSLVLALFGVAKAMKKDLQIVNVDEVGTSDNASFKAENIPEICIHSLTQKTWPILHSKKDQFAAVQQDDYFDSFQLIAAYVAYLDFGLDAVAPPAPVAPKQ